MRTKEELIAVLANHKKKEFFDLSEWNDLVRSVGGATQAEKDTLLSNLITRNDTQFGYEARQLLENDALQRATDAATTILADDTINLSELDQLL